MATAEQIRQYVISEIIEPARAQGLKTARVCAEDVDAMLGAGDQSGLICAALDSRLFIKAADVVLVKRTGPSQGKQVTWEYDLYPERPADDGDEAKAGQQIKEQSKDFLLAEYSMLRERFHSLLNEGVARLNYFLTMTSVILGGFLLVGSGIQLSAETFELIFLLLIGVLTVTGLEIFSFLVHRSRTLDKVERGMNRIRRYFVDQDPAISPYLIFTYFDEPTDNITHGKSGIRTTIQVYVSFMVGIGVGIGMNLLRFLPWAVFTFGLLAGVVFFIGLEMYVRRYLHKTFQWSKSGVHFPKNG